MCFTHFPTLCHAIHLLGTHYASPAALTCINSCTHMHSTSTHMHSHVFSCIVFVFMFTCFSCYSMVFRVCFALFKLFYFCFGTNLNLIKCCVLFCVCAPGFYVLCLYVHMSPTKHLTLRDQSQSVHAQILIILSLLRQI